MWEVEKFEAFELALSEKIVQEFGTSVETVTLCDMDYFANLKNDLKSQGNNNQCWNR